MANPFELYHESHLWPVTAPLLGVTAALIAKKAGRPAARLLSKGQSPEIRNKIMEAYDRIGGNRIAGAAGALTALAEGARTAALKNEGVEKTLSSLTDFGKSPSGFDFDLEPPQMEVMAMEKLSSSLVENANFDKDIVRPSEMIGAINNDKFLNSWEKLQAGTLISNSDKEKKGLTSGKKIAGTALRAGIGFLPSYYFGKTVAGIAGLPKDTLNRMGALGGMAGALYNSGIFGDKK